MTPDKPAAKRVFLQRLRIKDYKSIASCDIALQSFTAFIGPNGAGKSNIIDSLRFVTDSLRNSLEFALSDRGGIQEVRRRSKGHPWYFGISMHLNLWNGAQAFFGFRIGGPVKTRAYSVAEERCIVSEGPPAPTKHHYHVRKGELVAWTGNLQSAIEPDRLYLQAVSALPQFRPVYDALTRMGFYNLNPDVIRGLQDPDPARVLARDGRNIASVLKRLESSEPKAKRRIEQYLERVVRGVGGISHRAIGPKETVEFRQVVPADDKPWRFLAANMSDGTLRALGVLLSLFQAPQGADKAVPLVGLEEPESALHPAAMNALSGAILEAARNTQVLVTSHSPDLLDNEQISSDSILAVVSDNGQTLAAPVDEATRDALKQGLYTPGELLRIQQIEPDASLLKRTSRQWKLFANEVPI